MTNPAVSEQLLDGLERGLGAAVRRRRPTLVSASAGVEIADPAGAVLAARLASDRWFCWAEPEREFEIAALGSAREVVSRGTRRFAEVASAIAELGRDAILDGEVESPATGPLWVGGFAFADDGGASPPWAGFEPAAMTLPELSLTRSRGQVVLTVNFVITPGADPDPVLDRARARLLSLVDRPAPLLDPARIGRTEIRSSRPPAEFERAVSSAVEAIRSGGVEKVVLAREVVADAPQAYDAGAVFAALRELFPSCFCFCVGSGSSAFLGASPELLVRRSGASLQTVALAGSTRRSSDPAVDDHLGEQMLHSEKERREHRIVAERIVRKLRRHAVWVEATPEPELVRVANIQHLATPILAQLAEPRSVIELAGLLHPTPAVGGEPWPQANQLIERLEQLDRGWYAAPIGWMDAAEDGEFCVAVRSGLIRDREARLIAGGGMVEGSDPAAELAETEVKLEALLPLLSG